MIKAIVFITTFNLEDYIGPALDSVLEQITEFDYKVIVADDCSTDGTVAVLSRYKEKYGEKLEVVLAERNMGSLRNSNRVFDGLECEYFSFLDGDDYWVGADRLQKQVDFLDSHPEYMMCGGNTQYLRDGEIGELLIDPSKTNESYSFDDYVSGKMPFIHTSSILVRNTIFVNGLPKCYRDAEDTFENCALRGEDFRRILHLEKGPIFISKDILSVYRIHQKGLWQSSSKLKKAVEETICLNFYRKYFDGKYGEEFDRKMKESYRSLMSILVVDYNLLGEYQVGGESTYLLTSLLQDLESNKDKMVDRKPFKQRILRYIIKKFFRA